MKVSVIREAGYDEAVLGFSLSYNTSLERTKQILEKYAFGVPGENKFLESIVMWLDVTAPRFWWQEADTYRVGTSKQSESTMHTLSKDAITDQDFEGYIPENYIEQLNEAISMYRAKNITIDTLKGMLPEGFLQRRVWMVSYKTLQNIYYQRHKHRLPQWKVFFNQVIPTLEHPEFIEQTPKVEEL